MEDYLTVKLYQNEELELWKCHYLRNQAFVGVFDFAMYIHSSSLRVIALLCQATSTSAI